jgi:hypothetical protein
MQWWYLKDSNKVGPHTEEEIVRLAGGGQISAETYVWHEGMSQWEHYGSIRKPGANKASAGAAASVVSGPAAGPGSSAVDYTRLRADFLAGVEKPKIRDLINTLGNHPYDFPEMFPDLKGMSVRGFVKKKIAVLKNVEPLLGKLLFPGEQIQFFTTGIYSSFAEQYFLGIWANLINRTAFLFTNYRIIMMNIDSKGRILQLKWHVPYDQIEKFTSGGFLSASTKFKLKDKKSFVFSSVPSKDRKYLKKYVDGMIQNIVQKGFKIPCHQSRDDLCTNCFYPVKPNTWKCGNCGEEFIKPSKPALLSLCLPCLGDFYQGHRALGAVELVGYSFLWLILIMSIVAPDSKKKEDAGVIVILVIIAISHVVDAALTYHMAKKGVISVRHAWRSPHAPLDSLK